VYLWYVAVEGAKMAVVLGCSGSEGLAGPGNTVRGDGKNVNICCNFHKQKYKWGHYAGKNFLFISTSS
jgi:hypothetical protein